MMKWSDFAWQIAVLELKQTGRNVPGVLITTHWCEAGLYLLQLSRLNKGKPKSRQMRQAGYFTKGEVNIKPKSQCNESKIQRCGRRKTKKQQQTKHKPNGKVQTRNKHRTRRWVSVTQEHKDTTE